MFNSPVVVCWTSLTLTSHYWYITASWLTAATQMTVGESCYNHTSYPGLGLTNSMLDCTLRGLICTAQSLVPRCHFWHATLRLHNAIRRQHPPQRAVLSYICCFGEHKAVVSQIPLDDDDPRDAGTSWLSSPVRQRVQQT